jgi:hypothetical protein
MFKEYCIENKPDNPDDVFQGAMPSEAISTVTVERTVVSCKTKSTLVLILS